MHAREDSVNDLLISIPTSLPKLGVCTIEQFTSVLSVAVYSPRNPCLGFRRLTLAVTCVHPSKRQSRIPASTLGIACAFPIAGSRTIA
jgi:hypothetical protein